MSKNIQKICLIAGIGAAYVLAPNAINNECAYAQVSLEVQDTDNTISEVSTTSDEELMHEDNWLNRIVLRNTSGVSDLKDLTKKNFENISFISCEHQGITSIPKSIKFMKGLTSIDVSNYDTSNDNSGSNNEIQVLPDEIKECTNLKHLELSNVGLTSLPDLSSLSNLEDLIVGGNKLKVLPKFADNPLIEFIDADDNELTNIDSIVNCSKLRTLCCDNNKIATIPSFSKLENLKKLHFNNNSITSIDLSKCSHMDEVELDNNKLNNISGTENVYNSLSLENNNLLSMPKIQDNLAVTKLGYNFFNNQIPRVYGYKLFHDMTEDKSYTITNTTEKNIMDEFYMAIGDPDKAGSSLQYKDSDKYKIDDKFKSVLGDLIITSTNPNVIDNKGNVVGDGNCTVTASFSKAGKTCANANCTLDIKVDTKAPVIESFTYKAEPTNKPITLKVNATDDSPFSIRTSDGKSCDINREIEISQNGVYEFVATDIYGHSSKKSVEITNIDYTKPEFTLTKNTRDITNKDVTVKLSCNDDDFYEYLLPNSENYYDANCNKEAVFDKNYEYKISKNGTYNFVAVDKAGNRTAKEISISNIDKDAPKLELWVDSYNFSLGNKDKNYVDIKIRTIGDNNLDYIVFPDGSKAYSIDEATKKIFKVNKNGTYTYTIYDKAGNSTTKSIDVTCVDTEPPKISATVNYEELYYGKAKINVTASDDNLEYISYKSYRDYDSKKTVEVNENGDYTFTAVDLQGNSTSITVKIEGMGLECSGVTDDGFKYQLIINNGAVYAKIEGYEGSNETIDIPQYIGNFKVVSIDTNAFLDNETIKTVNIPETVSTIRDNAFKNCSNLESINLSGRLQYIFDCIVVGCSNLKNITVSSDNKYFTSENNILYSKDKSKLILCASSSEGDIELPLETKKISSYAFNNMQSKVNLIVRNDSVKFDQNAISNCSDISITGIKASEAETYATGNNIPFIELKDKDNEEKYTVNFKDYDGNILSTQSVSKGQAAQAPADTSREGYTFKGWDKAFDNVTSDMEVTALYEEKEVEPVDPTKPTNSDKPVDETKPTNPDKPVDETKPTDSDKPVDETKPTDSDKPVDGTKPTDSDKPVDGTKPTDSDKPVDETKPTDSDKPVVDQTKPTDHDTPENQTKPSESIVSGNSTNQEVKGDSEDLGDKSQNQAADTTQKDQSGSNSSDTSKSGDMNNYRAFFTMLMSFFTIKKSKKHGKKEKR